MPANVYYEVIAPTLVTGCGFIGITTLGEENNHVGKIIEARSQRTGKTIFKQLIFKLSCKDCIEEGKASDCIHMLGDLPRWQQSDRHEDLKEVKSIFDIFNQYRS